MKAMLVRLMMSARWAACSLRWVSHATNTATRIATGTMSETSRSQTASGLAKSE